MNATVSTLRLHRGTIDTLASSSLTGQLRLRAFAGQEIRTFSLTLLVRF